MLYSTMHLSINLFLFSSLFILFFNPIRPLLLSSSSETKLFELHSLPNSNLTFLGDSRLQYEHGTNAIVLTKEASRSNGMVLYSQPILFIDPYSKKVRSFSTMFVFSIKNTYRDGGEGLAFLISPDNGFLGSPRYMGLVDSTDLSRNRFIAIEFDTKYDPMFHDPDDNHLGLDINSLSSVQLATSSSVNLKSGDSIHTWIDYKSDEKRLEVFLSDSDLKPVEPLLKVDIDLSNYLKEKMFVGFSAATERSVQLTRIDQWEFTIVKLSSPPPVSHPPESGRIFPKPTESGYKHSHLSRFAIGFTIGACFVPFVIVFGWFCWRKLMGMIQKLEGSKKPEMQTIKSSGGASEIRLSIPNTSPDEVARGLIIVKVLDNEAELIRVKTMKFCIPFSEI